MDLLAKSSSSGGGDVVGLAFLAIVGFIVVLVLLGKAREMIRPRKVGNRMSRFFGASLKSLKAHDKTYPSYDLASVSRALASFFEECCAGHVELGSVMGATTLSDVIVVGPTSGLSDQVPGAPTLERVPVDLENEESFVANAMYLARVKPSAASPGSHASAEERIAVMVVLHKVDGGTQYDDDGGATHAVPQGRITVSVACQDQAVADLFFKQFEARRKRFNIYRGKVIDPTITRAGIQSIAFRRIAPVGEADLVLPTAVRELIHGSIVNFYANQDLLRNLGIELKRGILFHSPPGTGKTSVSLYLAGLLPHFTVCFVSGRKLLYPRELCAMARYLQPTMLVFEDIDLIAAERDGNGLATILGELMNEIDGCEPNDQVLFIMNTNSIDRMEQAVRNRPGRVDQIIEIPLPDLDARRQLLRHFCRNVQVAPEEVERAAAGTEGATPATLKEVAKRAAVRALQANPAHAKGAVLRVTGNDLLVAFEQVQAMRPVVAGA